MNHTRYREGNFHEIANVYINVANTDDYLPVYYFGPPASNVPSQSGHLHRAHSLVHYQPSQHQVNSQMKHACSLVLTDQSVTNRFSSGRDFSQSPLHMSSSFVTLSGTERPSVKCNRRVGCDSAERRQSPARRLEKCGQAMTERKNLGEAKKLSISKRLMRSFTNLVSKEEAPFVLDDDDNSRIKCVKNSKQSKNIGTLSASGASLNKIAIDDYLEKDNESRPRSRSCSEKMEKYPLIPKLSSEKSMAVKFGDIEKKVSFSTADSSSNIYCMQSENSQLLENIKEENLSSISEELLLSRTEFSADSFMRNPIPTIKMKTGDSPIQEKGQLITCDQIEKENFDVGGPIISKYTNDPSNVKSRIRILSRRMSCYHEPLNVNVNDTTKDDCLKDANSGYLLSKASSEPCLNTTDFDMTWYAFVDTTAGCSSASSDITESEDIELRSKVLVRVKEAAVDTDSSGTVKALSRRKKKVRHQFFVGEYDESDDTSGTKPYPFLPRKRKRSKRSESLSFAGTNYRADPSGTNVIAPFYADKNDDSFSLSSHSSEDDAVDKYSKMILDYQDRSSLLLATPGSLPDITLIPSTPITTDYLLDIRGSREFITTEQHKRNSSSNKASIRLVIKPQLNL